ncbi:uncharacterized protein LOC116852585 isoform X2 [Odontomachus brunneus]|uniref:uncharacterized protein LOC116852585 isoform X2 n=1 Tax=Odontomachus brunneus TaxID=486640 RepID=UPI0013F207B8|nr:uncharacterized protein LOC116852585 isoform X2 [Odontomachus brunneus]
MRNNYDETEDAQQVEKVEEMIQDSPVTTFSSSTVDKILIDQVHARRNLWDHTIAIKDRTKFKKEAQWQEIINALGGSLTLTSAKQKWRQLRDSYVKACKRMQDLCMRSHKEYI